MRRCCDTAGRLTGSPWASPPTAIGPPARRSKIARRVGSPSAVMASALVFTYGKCRSTQISVSRDEGSAMLGGLGLPVATTLTIAEAQAEFSPGVIFLNAATLGLPPRRTLEAIRHAMDPWASGRADAVAY